MELTILMPCLNEVNTLKSCITKANQFLSKNKIYGEILVADNGSTDGSQMLAIELGARVVDAPNKGYGSALIAGCNAARGQYIIMGDSDDSYNFEDLMPFLEKLREGYELVMGNRFKGGIEKGAMPPLHRYLGNPVLSTIGRILYRSPIKDFHCGLRGYNRQSILNLNLHTSGMEYASEMVVQATLHNLKICEIPTTLKKDGRNRKPHLKSWSDGWRHLTFLFMHAPNWLFLYPGLLFFISGVILSIIIVKNPIKIDNIVFDINTLVYSSVFSIIGFQLILFYILLKKYIQITQIIPTTKIDNTIKNFTMNKGIFIGFVLFMIGIIGSIIAVIIWKNNNFGNLDPSQMLRITIPSMTFIIYGIQLIFSSFFIGIFNIKRNC